MKINRILSVIMVAIVVIGMLGGCSEQGQVEQNPNTYAKFAAIAQEIIDKCGLYENASAIEGYNGLTYGEFIDFDNNGLEEMLLVYRDNDEYNGNREGGFATVVVYGMVDGEVSQMLKAPIGSRITQTDIGYAIRF